MRLTKNLIAATLALGFSLPASALTLTSYDLTLTIDNLIQNRCPMYVGVFGCLDVGDSFVGHFSVDSSSLLTDGVHVNQHLYDLSLTFGDATYSTGIDNEYLAAITSGGYASMGPAFRVQGGQVVELYASFAGLADIPFIDFPGFGGQSNRFAALDGPTYAEGTVTIASPAPEPEAWAMTLAGLAGVLVAVRMRRSAALLAPSTT